jgi:TatA/E family protein of Tat protein translocase
MFGLGYQELLLILLIALVFFGGSQLPAIAKSLGKSVKEFREAVGGHTDEGRSPKPDSPTVATTTPSRTCSSCKTPLQPNWAHCPRCGTSVPQSPTPTS